MKQLSMGISAPDFELKSLSGQPLRLSEALRTGPVVLAFYKASCPTCQLTFPYLQTIYSSLSAEFRNRIWGISQDDPAETAEFVEAVGDRVSNPSRRVSVFGLDRIRFGIRSNDFHRWKRRHDSAQRLRFFQNDAIPYRGSGWRRWWPDHPLPGKRRVA